MKSTQELAAVIVAREMAGDHAKKMAEAEVLASEILAKVGIVYEPVLPAPTPSPKQESLLSLIAKKEGRRSEVVDVERAVPKIKKTFSVLSSKARMATAHKKGLYDNPMGRVVYAHVLRADLSGPELADILVQEKPRQATAFMLGRKKMGIKIGQIVFGFSGYSTWGDFKLKVLDAHNELATKYQARIKQWAKVRATA